MNIIDIVLAALILITAFIGYRRGIVLSLLSLVRFAVSLPISYYISETYYKFVYDNFVHQMLLKSITDKINNSTDVNTYITELQSTIESIPKVLLKDFDLSSIGTLNSDTIAKYVTDNIAKPIAYIVIKIVLFLAVLLLFYVICAIITAIVKKSRNKNKKSLVKTTSSVLGAVFGIFKGCLLVLALASLAYLIVDFSGSDKNEFIEVLDSSAIIEFINEFNPIIGLF